MVHEVHACLVHGTSSWAAPCCYALAETQLTSTLTELGHVLHAWLCMAWQ